MYVYYKYTGGDIEQSIRELYLNDYSANEIKIKLNLPQTVRQLQKTIKKMGISRTSVEGHLLKIKKSQKKHDTIRYSPQPTA